MDIRHFPARVLVIQVARGCKRACDPERQAIVVTTNLAFAGWVTVFAGDEKLTTALLARLAHHATVITTNG